MADSIPPPGSPNIVPLGVTNAEINIANEPRRPTCPPMLDSTIGLRQTQSASSLCPGAVMID